MREDREIFGCLRGFDDYLSKLIIQIWYQMMQLKSIELVISNLRFEGKETKTKAMLLNGNHICAVNL